MLESICKNLIRIGDDFFCNTEHCPFSEEFNMVETYELVESEKVVTLEIKYLSRCLYYDKSQIHR